jgi:hypothetical protein
VPRARRIDPDDFDTDRDERVEEEPAPRRRRRAPSNGETVEHEDDPTPRRRLDEDEDEEPAPRRRRRAQPEAADEDEDDDDEGSVIPISRGRKEIKRNRPVGEGGDAFFRWDDEPQVVKFLTNEPWGYNQHWVTRDGKQSFPCIGRRCPLCEIGVKASQKVVYSIVNLSRDGVTQTLEVGVTLEDTLATYDADKKTGPLDRLYWALSRSEGRRSSGRSRYNYVFTPIKERDLEEDYGIDLDEAEDAVDKAEIPSPKQVLGDWNEEALSEIADEILER